MLRHVRKPQSKTPTNRLRVMRADRAWTQTDVSTRMKMPTKFRYWQIENGRQQPTQEEASALARIFGCDVADIFPKMGAAS